LFERYNVPPPEGRETQEWKNTMRDPIQLKVGKALLEMIEHHYQDFDAVNLKRLDDWTDEILKKDGPGQGVAGLIKTAIKKKRDFENAYTKTELHIPSLQMYTAAVTPGRWIFAVDVEELARQICLADFKIFQAVRPVELLKGAWMNKKLKHLAPNVLHLAERFNRLSAWVQATILWQETVSDRVRAWSIFVTLAENLLRLNNFSSVFSIIAAINGSPLHRLKVTQADLPKATVDSLENMKTLLSSAGSHKSYRELLKNCNPPAIPYIGVYCTDLTHIDDGNPNELDGLINFNKRMLIHGTIAEIQQFQQKAYAFPVVYPLHTFVTDFPFLTEDNTYSLSLLREPRAKKK